MAFDTFRPDLLFYLLYVGRKKRGSAFYAIVIGNLVILRALIFVTAKKNNIKKGILYDGFNFCARMFIFGEKSLSLLEFFSYKMARNKCPTNIPT